MKNNWIVLPFLLGSLMGIAQENDLKTDSLREVVIASSRIDLPFKENARTLEIITASDLKKLGVLSVADALQQVAGIDVRRQGINGMQADLYIRGGGFDQTLLLIDGIKLDDPQTGHHTMNLALPIEVIKRIEIIKGPAARIFGQNAFTGAVNIVTKETIESSLIAKFLGGSFGQFNAEITGAVPLENSTHLIHFSKQFSEGYRKNTDFDNTNYVLRSQFNKAKFPIQFIAALSEKKFGAQNFYGVTSSSAVPFESTQASVLGFSTTLKVGRFSWKPKLYWRRNQDEYVFIKTNPAAYRNLHITNKIAVELNGAYDSKLGTTGYGIEFSNYSIQSNNLGNAERKIATLFLEHRFSCFNSVLDLTPGVAVSYFSDFDKNAFPGIDIGLKLTERLRMYSNVGYTYRVPTYTDMNYSDPSTVGNPNLQAERAFAQELGVKYQAKSVGFTMAIFNRETKNFIDYRRATPSDFWQPINIAVQTKGVESSVSARLNGRYLKHQIQGFYTYIDDRISTELLSKNGINSMRHQAIVHYSFQFKRLQQNLAYRYIERTSGISYAVVDWNASYELNNITLSVLAQNIFNAPYFENTFVPMPKGNVVFGLKYVFK